MQKQISSALEQGNTVITATRRLARTLQQEYNANQQARGLSAWESPGIETWSDWMADLWQQLLYKSENPRTLLSSWQEQILWERVIRNSPESRQLLQLHSTASVAQEAWLQANQWRLDMAQVESLGNEDSLAFVDWSRRFLSVCDDRGWLEQARVADVLKDEIEQLHLPARVLLVGFDEFTPQQEDFLDASSMSGSSSCSIRKLENETPGTNDGAVRIPFPDSDREIDAAARWTRSLIETGLATRIGVVVADLASRRDLVERIFRGILEPESRLPGKGGPSRLINLSAGKSLSSYPIVKSALAVMSLSPGENDWIDISNLIRSAYLSGAETERENRALLDKRLRGKCVSRVKVTNVLRQCRLNSPDCPLLAQILETWLEKCGSSPSAQTAAEWSHTFSGVLEAFGWPGERPLNSVEYQAMQAWKDQLSTFASTDLTGGTMPRSEAVSLLRRIAGSHMFQPETERASVQILGLLEASGLYFDHLWIAGLHDEAWPGPSSPNPFLPISMQRYKGIPRCSPERELEFASLITRRLLSSGNNVVLSYPERREDREVEASPLISDIPRIGTQDLKIWNGASVTDVIRQSGKIETFVDEKAPPLGETARQRGGSSVFRYQSGCPFRAFAELRLGADKLESPAPGLDPSERGTLVHAVLEAVWKQLRTHASLCSSANLPEIIDRSVETAIERFERDRGSELPRSFAALEGARLRRLTTDWLEIEKKRPPFEVIRPEEEKYGEVGGIRFKVKIDRIDRLDDGREVIIDYKTGDIYLRLWDSERPEEPQLPLYSTIHENPLAAILFARIKTGNMGFLGFVDNDLVLQSCKQVDLTEKIGEWRAVMEKIGADFRAGRAEVDPSDPNRQCRYCHLSCLCRRSELKVLIEEDTAP